MKLQVLAILENGASKLFPRGPDTLRVHLILRDQQEAAPSSVLMRERRPGPQVPPRLRPRPIAVPA